MDAAVDSRTLRLSRIFDASRERVFAAWTEPAQFMAWMCPADVELDECELDVRPGGAWRAKGYTPTRRFAKSGVYLEVRRPELLVFTWGHHASADWSSPRGHETTVRVEFRALGQRTELVLTHGPFIDAPSFDDHDNGWRGSLDKLATFFGRSA
ncbi:MAG: SRPBCC domain-containing protein [Enhydrobacter sp.]|nr:MAG: SRPBCC domain-containing protein [Enhydrobacter sp.]